MKAPIRAFWWRWKHPHRLNFGDEITAPLVEHITGRRVEWSPAARCDLVGAGSVIQMVLRTGEGNRPLFWGSGFISAPTGATSRQPVDALAVRGELSRSRILPIPGRTPLLGDPGILAPLLLRGAVRPRYALGIVPHYHDVDHPFVERIADLGSSVRVIDVGWSPEQVAREIASCDAVLSSSLHGLIFADGLGVPNVHVRMSGKLKGGTHKFEDYYSAYPGPERYRPLDVRSTEGVGLIALVDRVHQEYVRPKGLRELQEGLVAALRDAV